jgi:hypothetical protein
MMSEKIQSSTSFVTAHGVVFGFVVAGQAGGAPQPVRGLKIHQVGSTVTLAVTGSPCFLGGASLPKYSLTGPRQFSGLTFSIIDVPVKELLYLNGAWSNVYCLPIDCIEAIKLHMACHADIHATRTFTQEFCGRHGVRVLWFGVLFAWDTQDYLPVDGSRTDYYIAPSYESPTPVWTCLLHRADDARQECPGCKAFDAAMTVHCADPLFDSMGPQMFTRARVFDAQTGRSPQRLSRDEAGDSGSMREARLAEGSLHARLCQRGGTSRGTFLHDGANSAKMEDNVEGVGGLIEVTKKKYGCFVGQQLRVLGRTGDGRNAVWKCTGGKTVPVAQRDYGWRWIKKGPVRSSVEDLAVSTLRTNPTMQPPFAATPWKPTIPCLAVDGRVDNADYSWMQ